MPLMSKKAGNALVRKLGGADHVHRTAMDYRRRTLLLDSMQKDLALQHPREWVGMTVGDELVFGPTHRELLTIMREQGLDTSEAVILYLDPAPMPRII